MGKKEFIEKWEEERKDKSILENLSRDNYDPNIYQYVRNQTIEITGLDPTVDENGNSINLTPDKYRALMNAVYLTKRGRAIDFSKRNLENILKDAEEKELFNISLLSKSSSDQKYKEFIKYLEEVKNIQQIIFLYKQGNEKEKEIAKNLMNQEAGKIIKEYLIESKKLKDEKEIKMWTNVFLYVSAINHDLILKIYQNKLEKLEEKTKKFKKPYLVDYIKDIHKKADEVEKERLYETIYEVFKSKE
ncbi:MAG: hypothetical protein QW117_03280 [Candidatus Pacearchaeota archaeon]